MTRNKIISYNSDLKLLARKLRNNSTKSEILLWMHIKNKSLGYQFHRQVPVDEFRQKRLERLGITVLRFSDDDVKKHLNDVLRAIQIVISEIEEIK